MFALSGNIWGRNIYAKHGWLGNLPGMAIHMGFKWILWNVTINNRDYERDNGDFSLVTTCHL